MAAACRRKVEVGGDLLVTGVRTVAVAAHSEDALVASVFRFGVLEPQQRVRREQQVLLNEDNKIGAVIEAASHTLPDVFVEAKPLRIYVDH